MECAENRLRVNTRDKNGLTTGHKNEHTTGTDGKRTTSSAPSPYNDGRYIGSAHPGGDSVSPEASRALLNEQGNIDKTLVSPIIKSNQYQVRKSAARALMDAALMMANISQLRTVLELGHDKVLHYYLVLGLTIMSLVMQIIFAILMFFLLMKESEMAKKKDYLEHLQMLESRGLPKETADNLKNAITNKKEDFKHDLTMTRLNYATIFLVFVITVINMFITGFGVRTKDE